MSPLGSKYVHGSYFCLTGIEGVLDRYITDLELVQREGSSYFHTAEKWGLLYMRNLALGEYVSIVSVNLAVPGLDTK